MATKTMKICEIDPKLFLYLFGNTRIELTDCEQVLLGITPGDNLQAAAEWHVQADRLLKVTL